MPRRYTDETPNAPPSTARYGGGSPIPKNSIIPRSASFTPRSQTIGVTTIQHLFQGREYSYSRWPSMKGRPPRTSSCSSPEIIGRDFDPEENHLRRSPSILARVKEKAAKWHRTLSAKEKSTTDPSTTPSWGVSLDDIDDYHFYDEDDPELLQLPVDESRLAPDALETASQEEPNPNQNPNLSRDVEDQVRGKGVSLKEYLKRKFEPGEDDKALARVISQALTSMAPWEKVKEAVTSLLRADRVVSSLTTVTISPSQHLRLASGDAGVGIAAVDEENRG